MSAAGHIWPGFTYNVENSASSPVTCKLCSLIVVINAENYLCGSLLLEFWIVN